jgi:hypothetical protein
VLRRLTLIGLGDLIGPQAQREVGRVGHGRDAGRVDGLKRLDQSEDGIELAERLLRFGGAEIESRQLGDARDVLSGESQRGPPWSGGKP